MFVTPFRADINKSSLLKLLLHCHTITEVNADFDVEIFAALPIVRVMHEYKSNYKTELQNALDSIRIIIQFVRVTCAREMRTSEIILTKFFQTLIPKFARRERIARYAYGCH